MPTSQTMIYALLVSTFLGRLGHQELQVLLELLDHQEVMEQVVRLEYQALQEQVE